MGEGGGIPLDAGLLRAGQVVAELVVHPVRTPLVVAAEAAGCTTVDGVGMLVHQAAIAFRHWTGVEPPLAAMQAGARSSLS